MILELKTYHWSHESIRENRLIGADNLLVTPGTGKTMAADEVSDATLGTVSVGFGKIMDGTLDSTNKLVIGSDGAAETQGDAAHDAVVTGNPVRIGGYASAAAPSDVSADGDAVNAWMLRNGATATVLTAAGALIGGDATNGLDVDVTRSALPSGASTLAEQQTQTTALQLIDDTVVAQGTALGTTKNSLVGGSVTTAAPTYTNGQINPLNLTTAGALRSDLSTIAGTAPTTAGKIDVKAADGDVYVRQDTGTNLHTVVDSGTVTTVSTVTNLAQLGGAAVPIGAGLEATAVRVTLPTDGTGKVSVVQSTATNLKTQAESYQGGTAVGAANPLQVTLANGTVPSHAVTNAGTFAVQASGDVAHDGIDSGNPVKMGAKAVAHGSNPTAVAAGDRTDLYANRAGIPFSIGGHPNVVTIEAAYTAAQTDTAIISAAGGTKIVVTQIQVVVSAATSVNTGFRVGFGTANTPTTTGVIATHPGILALSGSGVSRGNGSGIIAIGADGEDVRITCDAPTSGSIRVLLSYYTIES